MAASRSPKDKLPASRAVPDARHRQPPRDSALAGPDKLPPSVQRAMADPSSALPGDIPALQRIAGNRAVQRLLATPTVQPRRSDQPAADEFEVEADPVAEAVTTSLPAGSEDARLTAERDHAQGAQRPLAPVSDPLRPSLELHNPNAVQTTHAPAQQLQAEAGRLRPPGPGPVVMRTPAPRVQRGILDKAKGAAKYVWEGAKAVGSGIATGAKAAGRGILGGAKALGLGIKKVFVGPVFDRGWLEDLNKYKRMLTDAADAKKSFGEWGRFPVVLKIVDSVLNALGMLSTSIAAWCGLIGLIPTFQFMLPGAALMAGVGVFVSLARQANATVLDSWLNVLAVMRYRDLKRSAGSGGSLAGVPNEVVQAYLATIGEYRLNKGVFMSGLVGLAAGGVAGGLAGMAGGKGGGEAFGGSFSPAEQARGIGDLKSTIETAGGGQTAAGDLGWKATSVNVGGGGFGATAVTDTAEDAFKSPSVATPQPATPQPATPPTPTHLNQLPKPMLGISGKLRLLLNPISAILRAFLWVSNKLKGKPQQQQTSSATQSLPTTAIVQPKREAGASPRLGWNPGRGPYVQRQADKAAEADGEVNPEAAQGRLGTLATRLGSAAEVLGNVQQTITQTVDQVAKAETEVTS